MVHLKTVHQLITILIKHSEHMKFIKAILSLMTVLMLLSTSAMAQKDYTAEADMAFKYGSYYDAIELYKQAYTKEKKAEVKKRILNNIGMAYYYMQDNEQAITWLGNAIKAGYEDDEAKLFLADAQRKSGKLDEATATYQDYLEDHPESKKAKTGAESCKLAQEWKDNPTRWEVQPDPLLNSKQADFSPAWADRKNEAILFTSTREGSVGGGTDGITGQSFSSIWYTQQDKKGKWMVPTALGENINTAEANEGAPALNDRYNTLYFTRCAFVKKEVVGCKVFSARKRGRDWDVSEEVVLVDEDTITVGHPVLAFKDEVIIFASDMPGGMGGKDLWMATYDSKERAFKNPVNLGKDINTADDEMYPYLHEDGRLFFASNGHPGMGGFDIFYAEPTGDKKWGKVENMKYPINSVNNDFAIIFDGKKEKGYFSTDRTGGRGDVDLWSFRMPPLKFIIEGVVSDLKTGEPIPGATVALTGTDGSSVEIATDEIGFYQFDQKEESEERYIQPNTSYTLTVSAEGYLNGKGQETTVGVEKSTRFNKNFKLQPTGGVIEFSEVRYDLGKAELQVNDSVNSKDSLNMLYQTLIDNPTIVIELMAHTDSRGRASSNMDLSQRRAQSCVDYLITKCVDEARLVAKGYGESQLRITDEEIAKLPTEEEKEAAHQKNRRTEFRVLRDDYVPAPDETPETGEGDASEATGESEQ